MKARELLAAEGIRAAVVSMPCWELFDAPDRRIPQARCWVPHACRASRSRPASVRLGRCLGTKGAFVGMSGFGASAPYEDLYRHFGITRRGVAEAAKKLI